MADADDKTISQGDGDISQATWTVYRRHYDLLVSAFELEKRTKATEDPGGFFRWVERQALERRWTNSTIRIYRAALRYFFKSFHGINIPDNLMSEAMVRNRAWWRRKKFVRQEWVDWLKERIALNGGAHLINALAILEASRFFGLRPSEYHGAELDETHDERWAMLKVKNGKWREDGNRSFGEYRHILIRKSHPDYEYALKVLKWLLSKAKEYPALDAWKQACERAQHALYRQKKRKDSPLDPDLTIYSGRHQFASDLKKMRFDPFEIAALMGHADPNVHRERYGYARHGKGGDPKKHLVKPYHNDVEQVRKLNEKRIIKKSPAVKRVRDGVPEWVVEHSGERA